MAGRVTIGSNQTAHLMRAIRRGTARALTRAMQFAETRARRAVAAEVGATVGAVRGRLILDKATAQRLGTRLRFTGKRFRLIELGARQTAKGVTYRGSGRRRALIPGAFKATVGIGRHVGIFKRKPHIPSRAGRPRGAPALPIVELFSVSVPFAAAQAGILESTLEDATAQFEKIHAREIAFALGGSAQR